MPHHKSGGRMIINAIKEDDAVYTVHLVIYIYIHVSNIELKYLVRRRRVQVRCCEDTFASGPESIHLCTSDQQIITQFPFEGYFAIIMNFNFVSTEQREREDSLYYKIFYSLQQVNVTFCFLFTLYYIPTYNISHT